MAEGEDEGDGVGYRVGNTDIGDIDGDDEGDAVGEGSDGCDEDMAVGMVEGALDGDDEGDAVGNCEIGAVGDADGIAVGKEGVEG